MILLIGWKIGPRCMCFSDFVFQPKHFNIISQNEFIVLEHLNWQVKTTLKEP